MRVALLTLLWVVGWPAEAQDMSLFHARADRWLQRFVSEGKLTPEAAHAGRASLDSALAEAATVRVGDWPADHRKAFWINVHNLLAIRQQLFGGLRVDSAVNGAVAVIGGPAGDPVADIPAVPDTAYHFVMAGDTLMLPEVRRRLFAIQTRIRLDDEYPARDARLHFVLYNGATASPPLADYAIAPQRLILHLERRAFVVMNDPNFVRLDPATQTVTLPRLFRTYAADFYSPHYDLRTYLNRYRRQPIPAAYTIRYASR